MQLNRLAERALRVQGKTFCTDLNQLIRKFEIVERRRQKARKGKHLRGLRLVLLGVLGLVLAGAADLGPLAGGAED